MDGRHHSQIKLNMPFNYLMQKSLFSIDIKNISQEKNVCNSCYRNQAKVLNIKRVLTNQQEKPNNSIKNTDKSFL